MGWLIGLTVYGVLVLGVLILVGGVRRGDLRHDRAVLDLAAFDPRARNETPRLPRKSAAGHARSSARAS